MSFFFRISNYPEHVLFQSDYFFGTATFSETDIFRSRYFLKTVTFLIVLRSQFHSIFTWKDIRSSSILWFGLTLKFPNSLLLKIAKKLTNLNTECVTNVTFWEVGSNCDILKQAWKNNPNEFHSTLCSNVPMRIC